MIAERALALRVIPGVVLAAGCLLLAAAATRGGAGHGGRDSVSRYATGEVPFLGPGTR